MANAIQRRGWDPTNIPGGNPQCHNHGPAADEKEECISDLLQPPPVPAALGIAPGQVLEWATQDRKTERVSSEKLERPKPRATYHFAVVEKVDQVGSAVGARDHAATRVARGERLAACCSEIKG